MGDIKLLRASFAVNTHPGSNGSCRSLGGRLGRMDRGSTEGAVGQQIQLGSLIMWAAFG